MPVRIEPHAEPIPGYTLIERLGGGGFGEVWKAEAPGGLQKAIKFVYGDLHAADDIDGNRAEQELKALSRVKTVHHPYILSLERYDIIEGQLMIVMELADRTLWDRFKECRGQGLPGIPREELLRYLAETAEALDLMNQTYQLQHLDIKPQNLFLVFNHVKVADFGLVKDLGTMAAATVTGGVTPVYAAPETFDGWLSRFSDQYSLAIVYQELLTGHRPFTGGTVRQLVMQHLQGDPDLSMLPVADRPAVARALSKNPDDRFPACTPFIDVLRKNSIPKAVAETPGGALAIEATDTPLDLAAADADDAGPQTCPVLGKAGRSERPALDEPIMPRRSVLPARPDRLVAEAADTDDPTMTAMNRRFVGEAEGADRDQRGRAGAVQPAVVIGLGKLGVHTLVQLRRQLSHEVGAAAALPHVRLLGVDIDREIGQAVAQGDTRQALMSQEMCTARLHRPNHYLQLRDREGKLLTDSWLNSKVLYRVPKQSNSATLRALGRLAFVDNYRMLARRFEDSLLASIDAEALHHASQPGGVGVRSAVPRIYVVAGLGGATGSGMFLDAAYVMRHILRKHGYGRAEIVGLFYLPKVPADPSRSATALTQTYAALAELDHYATGRGIFTATYPTPEQEMGRQISEAGSPFQRCFFLEVPPTKNASIAADEIPEVVTLGGQFLYRDLATSIGQSLDEARKHLRGAALTGPAYHTFGMRRIAWPRRRLLDEGAVRLCRRTVERWMAKDAKALVERITQWSQEQWEAHGMRPEGLITRHLEACEKKLQQSPDRLIQEALAPLQKALAPTLGSKPSAPVVLNAAPVVSTVAALDALLGVPEECRDNNLGPVEPSQFERTLKEVGENIADRCDQKLSGLIVKLLEEPAFRLAGAEEALRQFSAVAEQSLRSQEMLSKELNERAALLYQRLHAVLESPQQATQSNSIWKLGFAKKTPSQRSGFSSDLLEIIRLYAKTRFQSLVLAQVNRQYVGLRGHFSDQIREVGFCRQRLGELMGLFDERPIQKAAGAASFERLLLPAGCAKIEEAVERLDGKINADDLLAFDKLAQLLIRTQYRALLTVCMGPSNLVRSLAPQMLQEAEKYLMPRVAGAGVAELWLTDAADEQAVRDQLQGSFETAAPTLQTKLDLAEIAVASLPPGETGDLLREQMRQALPAVHVAAIQRSDEIVFYRETQHLRLHDLPQFGPAAQELYRQRCACDASSVHCREDVSTWQPLAAAQ